MADADLTVAILREIRDEIRTTRVELKAEIGQTNKRLDDLTDRVDGVNSRVDGVNQRLDVVEITLKDLAGQQQILTRYLKNVVDRHDERLTRLETRIDER